jgi:SM-20-related protein
MVADAPLPQEVSVTIILDGGTQQTVTIQSNNMLLQELFETLIAPPENRPQRLFQIPITDGKAILCFPSDRLVGLVTEPPIILRQQPQAEAGGETIDPLMPGI